MGRIVVHRFDSSCLILKLLQGTAPIIIIQEVKDGRDEWCDFSGDRIAKGKKVLSVYIFDEFLGDGLFKY